MKDQIPSSDPNDRFILTLVYIRITKNNVESAIPTPLRTKTCLPFRTGSSMLAVTPGGGGITPTTAMIAAVDQAYLSLLLDFFKRSTMQFEATKAEQISSSSCADCRTTF